MYYISILFSYQKMAVITVIQRKYDTQLWRHAQRNNLKIHLRAFIAFMSHIGLDDFRQYVVEKQVHGKTVPQSLWIDGRERKFNPLFPGSVDRLLRPQPGCFPADFKQGASMAGSECGQIEAKLIDVCGIKQRHYPGYLLIS